MEIPRAGRQAHLWPVWAMWDDSMLWFSSAVGSRKTPTRWIVED